MNAKAESPITSKTSAEETVAVAEAAGGMTEETPAPKKRGRKPGVKNTASKKETTKKTTSRKTTKAAEEKTTTRGASKKIDEQIIIQYAGRECTKESMMNRINEIWANDYGKKASEMKKVAFYVKPEEFAVYYVINDDITGKFDI